MRQAAHRPEKAVSGGGGHRGGGVCGRLRAELLPVLREDDGDEKATTGSPFDAACDALVTATTALEGHEFIVPEISVKNGDTVIGETALIQVPEDTQKATLSLALNDGAMVKSTDIAVSDENGVKASVSGNDINITKTADKGTFNLTVKVVDEWGREYTKAYAISVINVVIPVTSLELTVDGNVVTDGKYTVSSGSKLTFNKFKGVKVFARGLVKSLACLI